MKANWAKDGLDVKLKKNFILAAKNLEYSVNMSDVSFCVMSGVHKVSGRGTYNNDGLLWCVPNIISQCLFSWNDEGYRTLN